MPRVTGLKNPIGDSLHSRDANKFFPALVIG